MRHVVLTRSAYAPCWDAEANRRRLALTEAVTARSLRAQADRRFEWIVLLHRDDELLAERRAVFAAAGARFIYLDATGDPSHVAWQAYRAGWAEAIGARDDVVAMTRLDDDDALAPWVVSRIHDLAPRFRERTAIVFPVGIRVWGGRFTVVYHDSNAMQTLVTQPGDALTVYDYKHREVKRHARVRRGDPRPAWLWSRHPDTISGWREAEKPLTDEIRSLFPVDWSALDTTSRATASHSGRFFR